MVEKENHTEHDKIAKEAIVTNVEKFGCHLALIDSNGYLPAFAYSIGLYKNYGHPEIITFGLKTNVMGHLLNYARDEIKKGMAFKQGPTYSGFLEGYKIQFLNVDKEYYPDYFGYAGWYYKNSWDFPAIELIWPDKENRWPWEDSFNEHWKYKQPLLDRNIDFKFYEPKNLGVYTTHHVLEGNPKLYVYHNDDGDWQFHSEQYPNPDDAKLVCLSDLVERDSTLNLIHHIGYGYNAWRETSKSEWNIEKDEDDTEE